MRSFAPFVAGHLRQSPISNLQSLIPIALAFLLGFSPWWIQFLRLLRTFPLGEVMGPAVGDTFLRGSLALTPPMLAQSVVSYLTFLVYQFGPHGVALGLYGWWKGRAVSPRLWSAALALYVVYLLFGLVYRVSDQFAFFLGAHLFWAVALALGLARLAAVLKGKAQWALAVTLGLALLLTPVFYGAAPSLLRRAGVTEASFGIPQIGTGVRDGLTYYLNPNKRGDTEAYEFGQRTLQQLPPDALVLAEWYVDTDEYFVFRYFAAIEGRRPDVEVLGWPTVDPFAFDPALVVQTVERELPRRPVYLASLSDDFYAASELLQRYCITSQHDLYRIHAPDSSPSQPCLTP